MWRLPDRLQQAWGPRVLRALLLQVSPVLVWPGAVWRQASWLLPGALLPVFRQRVLVFRVADREAELPAATTALWHPPKARRWAA